MCRRTPCCTLLCSEASGSIIIIIIIIIKARDKAHVRPSLLFSDDEDGLGAQNVRRCIQVAENDAALPASEKSKSSKKKAARGLIVCENEFRMMVTKAQAEANRALIGIFSVYRPHSTGRKQAAGASQRVKAVREKGRSASGAFHLWPTLGPLSLIHI